MTEVSEVVTKWTFKADKQAFERAARMAKVNAEKAEEAYVDASKKVEKAQKAVAEASTDASKKAAMAALDSAKKQQAAAEQTAREARGAAKSIGDSFGKAYASAGKSAKAMSTVVGGALQQIGMSATNFAINGIQSLARGAIDTTKEMVSLGREVKRNSDIIGTTTDEYQRFIRAAELTGTQTENAFEAAKTFRENLGELARLGTGPAKDALGSLGIQLEEIIDLPLEQQFGLFADRLNELAASGADVSVALEVMGDDGGKLLPLLHKGSQGIKQFADAAQENGAVLEADMIERLSGAQDGFAKLDQKMLKAKATVADALAPQLEEGADSVGRWIDRNEEFIQQDLPTILDNIAEAAGFAAKAIMGVGKAYNWVVEKEAALIEKEVEFFTNPLRAARRAMGLETETDAYGFTREMQGGAARGAPALSAPQPPQDQGPMLGEFEFTGPAAPDAKVRARRAAEFDATELASQGMESRARVRLMTAGFTDAEATAFLKGKIPGKTGGGKTGGGGARSARGIDTTLAEAEFGAEIDQILAGEDFVSADQMQAARQGALEAAARSFQEGGTRGVGRDAAMKALSSSVGRDVSAPKLSDLLGNDVPDVELSTLARGAQPQVLTSIINNTFTFDIDQQIDGAGSPVETGQAAAGQIRQAFEGSLPKATKLAKVRFAR